MRPKTLFAGRPHLDTVVRVVALAAVTLMLIAAVATADGRLGALAVGLAAFVIRETFELEPLRDRVALLVLWASLLTWVAFTLV